MPSLSSQQHQSIQEFVKGVLQAALDNSTRAKAQPAENSDDAVTVSALASAVRSAADEGIASFLEAHNKRHSNPVVRLPPELSQTCFRLLDLRGRVVVSHVSRTWRRVALADCGLWNTLTFSETPPESVGLDMFRTLLARAGSRPFDFTWMSLTDAIPEALLVLVLENMGRMGSLILENNPEGVYGRLLQHKAPWMKSLTSMDESTAVLPADWGTHWVPRLETLHLLRFAFPEGFEPLSHLRSLEGRLAPKSCSPILSRWFPRLVKLNLWGVTQESVQHLGAPPTSCRTVLLRTVYGHSPVDYSPFLQACYDHPIPFISVGGPSSLCPSVMEFAHVTRGPCRMIIYHERDIRLECDEEGITRELSSGPFNELPILNDCRWFAYLDRFTGLSLPLSFLPRLRQLEGPPSFNSVRSLTISLPADPPPESLRPEHGDIPPLQMPLLEDLTLDAYELDLTHIADHQHDEWGRTDPRWIADRLPDLLPTLIRTERARLEQLEVVVYHKRDGTRFISRLDLTALRGVARVLRIRDRESVWVQEFIGA